ncbi:MAG: 2-oxo acid dehydrogenase subunit E2 [Pseudomonadota bacterium]
MAKTIDITVPDLGEFENVEVIELLVSAGDVVEREDGLITLETDKAAMDVPSPENGKVESLTVAVGDTVSTGDVIGTMSIQVDDTVVIAPAIAHEPTGDTTVLASPAVEGVAAKSGGVQTLIVPDLGDFEDVEVIEVHIANGDEIDVDDPLVTLETDKAAMDVPAVVGGRIESVLIRVGDSVSAGASLAIIEARASEAPPVDASQATEKTLVMSEAQISEVIASPEQSVQQSGGIQALTVPDLGDFDDVEVIEVHVNVGDEIDIDDPLITLETDKAAMDVPAEFGGKIESMDVSVGDTVSAGASIGSIDARASVAPAAGAPAATETTQAIKTPVSAAPAAPSAPVEQTPRSLPPINESGFSKAHASPSVRKLARELGVNLPEVKGSGAKGRILHDDVKAFVKAILTGKAAARAGAALPKTPVVDFGKFGDVEEQALTRIQKISGPRLQASWINLPHVTQHDEADITELEARRQELKGPAKERGVPLTPLAFVLKACVKALQEFPKMNSSLSEDGKSLVLKKYCHLGFAADTEQGLMVPVIRDADQMTVYELATALAELSGKARDGKLKANELQGASFTVSSLGGIGGTAFTPIVNAPEVAILGVSRSSMQPVWNGSEFEPRLMLPYSLSYDHRVIDGAAAVRFTTYLAQVLADVDGLLEGTG